MNMTPHLNFISNRPEVKFSIKGPAALSFQTGEILKGLVSEIISSNRVIIQLKNQFIQAKTEIPLRAGEIVTFEVISTEGQVHLKRLPEMASLNMTALLLKGLGGLGERSQVIAQMEQLLVRLKNLPESILKNIPNFKYLADFFKGFNEISDKQLKTAITSSGLFFEAKIKRLLLARSENKTNTESFRKTFEHLVQGDLKGLLLKLKEDLRSKTLLRALEASEIAPKTLLKEIDTVLNEIRHQQFESKLKEGLQIFLPFIWRGLEEGRVFFKRSQGYEANGKEKCVSSCTIFLKLEKIGKLKAQIQMHSGLFYAQLISENLHFVRRLEASRTHLKMQLSPTGLQWADISIRHQSKIDFETPNAQGIDLKA